MLFEYLNSIENIDLYIGIIQKLVVIFGVIVAFKNYRLQTKQVKINNTKRSIEEVKQCLNPEKIKVLERLSDLSFEGADAKPGHFKTLVNFGKQIPFEYLFDERIDEIDLVEDFDLTSRNIIETNILEIGSTKLDTKSIREIANHLNIISYELLNGYIDARLVYIELGEVIEYFYYKIDQIQNQESKEQIIFQYRYLVKNYQKYNKLIKKAPGRNYMTFHYD